MLKHIVMWRLKDPSDAPELKAILEALPAAIEEITSFQVGINTAQGDAACDVVLVSAFADEAALDRYRVHPQHQEVVTYLGERAAERYVVDYVVEG